MSMDKLKKYLKQKEDMIKKKNRFLRENLRISIFLFKKVRCMMENRASKKQGLMKNIDKLKKG